MDTRLGEPQRRVQPTRTGPPPGPQSPLEARFGSGDSAGPTAPSRPWRHPAGPRTSPALPAALPPGLPLSVPAGSSAGPGGAAGAWLTGMKGTLKLNSVAEEEKSRLVPVPPPGFAAAIAAPRPRPCSGPFRPHPRWRRRPRAAVRGGRRARPPFPQEEEEEEGKEEEEAAVIPALGWRAGLGGCRVSAAPRRGATPPCRAWATG